MHVEEGCKHLHKCLQDSWKFLANLFSFLSISHSLFPPACSLNTSDTTPRCPSFHPRSPPPLSLPSAQPAASPRASGTAAIVGERALSLRRCRVQPPDTGRTWVWMGLQAGTVPALTQTWGLRWLPAEPGACRCLCAGSSAKPLKFITVELGDLHAICLQLPAHLWVLPS